MGAMKDYLMFCEDNGYTDEFGKVEGYEHVGEWQEDRARFKKGLLVSRIANHYVDTASQKELNQLYYDDVESSLADLPIDELETIWMEVIEQ